MEVTSGSKWRSSDYSLFVVEAVKTLANDVWVEYSKADKYGFGTDQKYSCLVGAFKLRFYPVVD